MVAYIRWHTGATATTSENTLHILKSAHSFPRITLSIINYSATEQSYITTGMPLSIFCTVFRSTSSDF